MTHFDNILKKLNSEEFVKELRVKGEVFLVGGIVRDTILEKQCKDIDLLVSGIPISELIVILQQFGHVDQVGKSFGVIKFIPTDMQLTEPIDIAIPRTECKTGVGHADFDVVANHDIPVIVDLKRRDFTINAIAVNLDGTVVDPFNGLADIKNKVIRMVDDIAFADDPLRMLRAIQFASRFKFHIETNTFASIVQHADDIKSISANRILIELDKIQLKGDPKIGLNLLAYSGLFKHIFGCDTDFENIAFDTITNKGDFYFTLLKDFEHKSTVYKQILSGDTATAKVIDAIQYGFDNAYSDTKYNRRIAFEMYKIASGSFSTGIVPVALLAAIAELQSGLYPKTISELAMSGDDLLKLGFKGKEIGIVLNTLLDMVYADLA